MTEEMIAIATPPDGEMVMRPGRHIANGLAIVRMPPNNPETEHFPPWSITHIGTGYYLTGAVFACEQIAIQFIDKLTEVIPDLTDMDAAAVVDAIGKDWGEIRISMLMNYLAKDDEWCELVQWTPETGP